MTTQATQATHPLANLRDLGGIPVDGGRVRTGVLLRSDDVALIDADGAEALVAEGLSLILDLRSGDELAATGRGVLEAHPVEHRHLPLMGDVTQPAADVRALFVDVADPLAAMGEMYAGMLRTRAEQFVLGLTAIADGTGGALFHCAAGKDRTGVFAATVLSLLGAAEEDIVADYARTTEALEGIMARMNRDHPAGGAADAWKDVPAVLMTADPGTMRAMLATIAEEFGSIRALLDAAGYDDALHARLRERLVEPA
ncbi:tyrosine-protein phosphatase [Nocardioides sp. YIM 152588]|uniref:tyrosine-protein phosphatase n=1 Tax=Nocardioides sp. YIM 152588 TaxID=3158259 RepID=UPI0032E47E9E